MSGKHKLVIEFDNEEALKAFGGWLCGSGEQQYWDWMEFREAEEDGPITAVSFHYHTPGTKGDIHSFLADNTIRTTCGRLSEDEDV